MVQSEKWSTIIPVVPTCTDLIELSMFFRKEMLALHGSTKQLLRSGSGFLHWGCGGAANWRRELCLIPGRKLPQQPCQPGLGPHTTLQCHWRTVMGLLTSFSLGYWLPTFKGPWTTEAKVGIFSTYCRGPHATSHHHCTQKLQLQFVIQGVALNKILEVAAAAGSCSALSGGLWGRIHSVGIRKWSRA